MILPKSQPTWKLSKKIQETTESQPLSAAGDLRGEGTQATVLQRGKPRFRVGTTTGSGPHVGGSAMCEGCPAPGGPCWPTCLTLKPSSSLWPCPHYQGAREHPASPRKTPNLWGSSLHAFGFWDALSPTPPTLTLGRVRGTLYSISFYTVMQLEQSLPNSQ